MKCSECIFFAIFSKAKESISIAASIMRLQNIPWSKNCDLSLTTQFVQMHRLRPPTDWFSGNSVPEKQDADCSLKGLGAHVHFDEASA